MDRTYTVKPTLAPGLPQPPNATLTMGFAQGALSAAIKYTREYLPGYTVIPGAQYVAPYVWRVEVINDAQTLGGVLYVHEEK